MLDLVTGILSTCIERMNLAKGILVNKNRGYEILEAFGNIIDKRQHVEIDLAIQKICKPLFKFEEVGVLFVDGVEADSEAPNLYKINHLPTDEEGRAELTEYDLSRGFKGINSFPKTLGITGLAI